MLSLALLYLSDYIAGYFYFYLELGGTDGSEIISWGSCLEDCPVHNFTEACEQPPPVPTFPLFNRKRIMRNYNMICLANDYHYIQYTYMMNKISLFHTVFGLIICTGIVEPVAEVFSPSPLYKNL